VPSAHNRKLPTTARGPEGAGNEDAQADRAVFNTNRARARLLSCDPGGSNARGKEPIRGVIRTTDPLLPTPRKVDKRMPG
jgi:hypothetical protein